MKDHDAKKEQWLQFRLQASGGFVGLPNRLIDSKAFAALTTGASVQVLVWFWQMVDYEKKRKGGESYIGRIDKMTSNGEMSFTFQEAGWRGLSSYKFAKALKQLFRYGFIDITRHGRGVGGEYTKYAISNRWQKFGTSEWQEIPYPENFKEGFRSDEYKAKQRKRRRINSVSTLTLPALADSRYEEAKIPDSVSALTLKTPISPIPQREFSHVSIDLAMPLETPTWTGGKVKKRTRTPDSRSKGIAAAIRRDDASPSPKTWRPPLSEIRENVAEILRQRPDPRADDPQFVRLISDQLGETLAGRLDPGRVHSDFQAKGGFDDWTTDLLFTIATINLIPMGATN